MTDETHYEEESTRTRNGIAAYLRRIARRLRRGEPVPVDEEQSVVVDPPAETEFEVELEEEGDEIGLELEMEWPTGAGTVETDASKARVEMYQDAADEWRWRLVHDNGNVIADSGEGYEAKRDAENGLDSVRENAPGARLVDLSRDEKRPDDGGTQATFELYRDASDDWRWRLVHDNGNVVADGGQGYGSKRKTKQGLRSVRTNVRGARVEEM